MRRLLPLSLILFLVPFAGSAQFKWDFGGSIGASNYLGEIGGKELTRRDFVADLKFSQTHIAASAFARYKVHPNISLKAEFIYGRISGADRLSTNPGRVGRNLNFRNDIFELAFTGEFFFYEINDIGRAFRYRNDFRAYIYAGIGGMHHNPKGQLNGQGEWIALQPLGTEGQNNKPGMKPYSLWQVVVPTGAGFYFTINKEHRITYEIGWRTTFTDYLDDISTIYASDAELNNDPLAIAMANQSQQAFINDPTLPPGQLFSYAPGQKRGDPTHNDSYIFTTVGYSYVIRGKSKFGKSRYGKYFKGNKYKKRKIRAKF
ncbi:MAG: DUF6089 family protein [Bacteroidota bacterium]